MRVAGLAGAQHHHGATLSLQDSWATAVLFGSTPGSDAGTGADRAATQCWWAGAAYQHVAEREEVPFVLRHLLHATKEIWP